LEQNYDALYAPFSAEHWLGCDMYGRDLLSRILYGASVSLRVACTSPFIGMTIGLILGMMAGYFRGKIDSFVSIFIDSILAFPNIVLAIAVLFYAGATMTNLILVISFYTIPQFTRIARANTILYAQRDFVLAAHAQGASHFRILYRELFPNIFVPVAAFSLLIMSFTIVLEGGLSFLGVGLPPPTPTWGRMIADGIEGLADDPKIVFIPSLFMFLTILSLNLIGDRLRAFTDVKASNA
jgi:peptide/nickel transport system permease protein